MSDDLRTRIAALLYRRWWPKPNRLPDWEFLSETDRQIWLADADAVIRELGIREERETTDWETPDGKRATCTRIASEWKHQAGCECGWCRIPATADGPPDD